MSNKLGFRVVSTFVGPEQSLRWKVQQLADDDSEAKWVSVVYGLSSINLFEKAKDAVKEMRFLIAQRIAREANGLAV